MMDDSMLRMQQEAVERVRQMQERARRYVEQDAVPVANEPEVVLPKQDAEEKPKPHSGLLGKTTMSLLDGFGEDKEQLLLLMLAVLLVKNNAPIELILALLYIAM